jgi:TolB-like protein
MTYQLRVLGRFELTAPDGGEIALSGKKNQALLAILAVAGGEWVPRSRLCDLLWQDRGEDQARNSLRQALAAVRRAFAAHGDVPLRVTDDAVAINVEEIACDGNRLNGAGKSCAADGLEFGTLLDGLNIPGTAIEDWLLQQRRRFHELYCEVVAARIDSLEAAGRPDAALAAGRELLGIDPLNETAHRAVIRLLAATGQRTAALKQYETCCDVLMTELGVEPEQATRQLHASLKGDGNAEPDRDGHSLDASAGDVPGIVVLPFENLSSDPGQDYFSNGLTDSITNELSRFHDLFVIASTSAFTYRNSKMPTSDICRELGVRYVLEGSVQRAGDRVRINVQLVDGISDRQVWAERYDREMDDLFAIQDDVTESIVANLATTYGGRLRRAWQHQRRNIKPSDVKAFDLIMRAIDELDKFTDDSIAAGRRYLLEAIELDPDCAKAHAKLGWMYMLDAVEGWKDDFEADLEQARQCALRAISADDGENWAHWVMAGVEIYSGQHDVAIAGFEKTLKLNPNDADVLMDYGYYLSLSGRPEDGLEVADKAVRLNPHHPDWYIVQRMQIYFDLHRYRDAIAAFRHVRDSITPSGCLYLAASHAAVGELDEARTAVQRATALDPLASVQRWTDGRMLPYRNAGDMEHLRTHLRAAGLPE